LRERARGRRLDRATPRRLSDLRHRPETDGFVDQRHQRGRARAPAELPHAPRRRGARRHGAEVLRLTEGGSMERGIDYTGRERAVLRALAAIGGLGVNGAFIYGVFARPGALAAALTNPIALAFVLEALILMGM